jgi:hypothetical protein
VFDPSNASFAGTSPCVPNWQNLGIPVHKFIFDMCNHVDTFLSEPSLAFRLTFDKHSIEVSTTPLSCGVTFFNG